MGRGGGSRLPPKIVIDIPKGVSADFVDAFTTRVVEATTSTWEFNYGLLQQFVDREGHARVTARHREVSGVQDFALGSWVSGCRTQFDSGRLSPKRVAALEALPGWEWDPFFQ